MSVELMFLQIPRRLSVCLMFYREQRIQASENPRERLNVAVRLERERDSAGVCP